MTTAFNGGKNDAKKVFRKLGTCSRTFFFLLNREFGNSFPDEERATDTLSGGLLRLGYQCGMLWGASFAVGAELAKNPDSKNNVRAIIGVQRLLDSFEEITESHDCSDITEADFTKKLGIFKYMITGKMFDCFKLSEKWAPAAADAARRGMSEEISDDFADTVSCASEYVKRAGGSELYQAMAAGLAGGLGLSGNACGALASAVWMKTMKFMKENPGKSAYDVPEARVTLEAFYKETDHEILCSEICGRKFADPLEHSEYIKNGGCSRLIKVLAES